MAAKKKAIKEDKKGNLCRLSRHGQSGWTPDIPANSLIMGYKMVDPITGEKERFYFAIQPNGSIHTAEYEDGTVIDVIKVNKANPSHIVWCKETMKQLYKVYGFTPMQK